jgi:hypothetical protein
MRIMRWFMLSLLVAGLAACGSSDDSKNDTPPTATGASALLSDLQQQYTALRETQQAIGQVWEALATGQQAQCGEYPEVLNPATISAGSDESLQPLADLLHRAAVSLNQAVDLWKAECLKPRANPTPEIIDQGRLAARAAGDALNDAEDQLTALQP